MPPLCVLPLAMLKREESFLIFSGYFDLLDGAIARSTKTVSRFGGFFDSVLDRYTDLFDVWNFCTFSETGSYTRPCFHIYCSDWSGNYSLCKGTGGGSIY